MLTRCLPQMAASANLDLFTARPIETTTLTELRRAAPITRIGLRGLEVEEVRQMMSSIAAKEVATDLAEAVQQQTEGNPLFVQEVLRMIVFANLKFVRTISG